MTVTHGMDTAAGRVAGEQLDTGAQEIRELAGRLDALLHSFDWTGSDAERVRETWQVQERPDLDAAAGHLSGLAALLRAEAEAQDGASDSGAGGGTAVAAAPAAGAGGWLSRIGSWIGDRVGAFATGLARSMEHKADFWGKVGDVLTGREDWSVSEIAASALAGVGAEAGAWAGLVTGEDGRWFGEGAGVAGTPSAVPTDAAQASQYRPALTPPTDLASLMQGVADGYQVGSEPGSTGDVRITRVDNGTGTPGYVVAIPGTENWSPSAGAQPRDLSANLNLVAGNPTAAAESVQRAMEAAGIPPGAPVMLVGHSQGGIIAGALASDPAFMERFGVSHVMTYGAPIDHMALDPRVQVMQMQHGADLVPRLDLGGLGAGGFPQAQPTVTLESPGSFWELGTNHSYAEYQSSVREAMGAGGAEGRSLAEYQASLGSFLVGPGGSASAVDVPVSRRVDQP